MFRLAILLGTGNATLAILLGAFGAHAIQDTLSVRMLSIFNTAVDYHLYHALGLIVIGLLIKLHPTCKILKVAVYLMLFGIIIFCGSLYTLSLTGISKLGMITPFGGIAFITAWLFVFIAFIKQEHNH
ncbi:MAG: DUF423 domain-containing protein [Gammaproteobacteria bacterium]|nr:MAG: DUF423 domain-containing protein [Gammaproteobacteria bacterium]